MRRIELQILFRLYSTYRLQITPPTGWVVPKLMTRLYLCTYLQEMPWAIPYLRINTSLKTLVKTAQVVGQPSKSLSTGTRIILKRTPRQLLKLREPKEDACHLVLISSILMRISLPRELVQRRIRRLLTTML